MCEPFLAHVTASVTLLSLLGLGRGGHLRETEYMELSYPTEAETFRHEIRTWLKENLPTGWGEPGFELTGEARKKFVEEWPATLYAGGWICATWPKEYGGKGLTTMQGVVLSEEFAAMKAPLRADFFGDTLVGPTLLQWGSEEQKKSSCRTS